MLVITNHPEYAGSIWGGSCRDSGTSLSTVRRILDEEAVRAAGVLRGHRLCLGRSYSAGLASSAITSPRLRRGH
jgi:hypothetical protein